MRRGIEHEKHRFEVVQRDLEINRVEIERERISFRSRVESRDWIRDKKHPYDQRAYSKNYRLSKLSLRDDHKH